MEARQVQGFGVLRERDRVAPLLRDPPDLVGECLGVPDHRDCQRDEPVRRVAAPLVDVPVVVRLDQHLRGVFVVQRGEEAGFQGYTALPAVLTRNLTLSTLRDMNYDAWITIDPGKRSGKPCIRGTRITVMDVLEYLAGGMSINDILVDFPELTEEAIRACLAFAADRERRLFSVPAA